jgi:hypothetical protein
MKPKLFFVLFILIAAPALTQMTPGYSTYATVAAGATKGEIVVSGVLDGTATCAPGYSLCDSIYHQGQVRLSFAGNTTTTYGNHVVPTGYVSVSNVASATLTPGQALEVDSDGQVYCSGIGNFIFTDLLTFSVGFSETLYAIATNTSTMCSWNKSCPVGQTATCGVGVIYGTPPCANFVEQYFAWYNFGAGNVCLKSGPAFGSDIPVGGCD